MAPFYKTLPTLHIVFMMLLGAFFAANAASAANPLFTVGNVTVDVTAENALQAREQAFEQAQVKAFEQLTARMLPESQLRTFQRPPPSTTSAFVQDYEVSNEKLSAKRYIGTYKFRFKDRDVKRYFSGRGTRFTDVASRPILILPFLETGAGTLLWSHQNAWIKAWSSTPGLPGGLVPVTVPLGDLADIADIGDDEALTYSRDNLNRMLERYAASEAVIAIARAGAAALHIELYRTDRARPEYVRQILEPALPDEAADQLYLRAVHSVKAALRQDWKQKTAIDATQQGVIRVRVQFSSLPEWSDFQRSLSRIPGLADVALTALSPKEAYLDLTYHGDIERLKLALAQAELVLNAPRLQAGGGAGMIYSLTRRRAAGPAPPGPGVQQPARLRVESHQTRF